MAVYVRPQVLVFQEFNVATEADIRDLPAFIFGGNAFLLRYSEDDEKANAFLGQYDPVGQYIDGEYKRCYSWPEKPVGSRIDDSYTRVFMDEALLRYHNNQTLAVAKTAAATVRWPNHGFVENPESPISYPRDALFLDRDVQVGDIVRLEGDDGVGGARTTLWSYVKSITATQGSASIAAATTDSGNPATQVEAKAITAGSSNSGDATMVIGDVDVTSYDGLASGYINETYRIQVIQGSVGGDPSTAVLRVISGSGLDDDESLTPEANFDDTHTIGARGLTVAWENTSTEFVAGDYWDITVTQGFTKPAPTSAGTYVGTQDRTYIVTVTKGGVYADDPEITVTAVDGSDYSGPTEVPAAATPVAVGRYGVTVQFSGTQLRYGDRYYIVASSAADQTFDKITLGHNIPAAATANFTLELFIKKNIELDEKHVAVDGQYNWAQSETELCVYGGVQAYDDDWTDGGDPVALDVIIPTDSPSKYGKLYVQYRAWMSDLAITVESVYDPAEVDAAIPGALSPDNPLKWGVYYAAINSNGQEVKFMAVANPDSSSSWSDVLEAITDRPDVYGLVPLTHDTAVLNLVAGHVDAQSVETMGRWRVMWTALQIDSVIELVGLDTSSDSNLVKATVEDDPDTSGTQYTLVRLTTGNADIIEAGVRPGDVFRINYGTNGFGEETYEEYVIDSVENEETFKLVSGPGSAITSVPFRCEIWRTLTVGELATAVGVAAGAWGNRRVRAVWPDVISSGDVDMDGMYACCALAGLSSGVVPHQGLTELEIQGFDDVSRTTKLFSRSQLDSMAGAGAWIVTQDPQSGTVYTRHALTTAASTGDLNFSEEMVTRNVDSISYYFLDTFSPYIGKSNVTPGMLDIIEAETRSAIQFLRASNSVPRIGAQLIDADISDLRISPVHKDRIILTLDLDLPYPLNNLEVHLVV